MVGILNNSVKNLAELLKVPHYKTVEKEKIACELFKLIEASHFNLGGKNAAEWAQIQQYIEYCLVYASKIDNRQNFDIILHEINSVLALKTYLVAHHITIADLLLYDILWDIVNSFSFEEQKKYLNICRWIDNLQQDSIFKHSNKLINFSTLYLIDVITKLK